MLEHLKDLFRRKTPKDKIEAMLNRARHDVDEAAIALVNQTEHQQRCRSDLVFLTERVKRLELAWAEA